MNQLLEVNILEGTYYFQKDDIFIKSKILDFQKAEDNLGNINFINLYFVNGVISIHKLGSKVKKINRPANIIGKFEWCFLIKNSDNQFIGYIGKPI